MNFKKIIMITVLILVLLLPTVGFAADALDTEEVIELRKISMNCYYRESPPHGDKALKAKKGDTVYVIEEKIISANEYYPMTYLLCNTEEGQLWIWKGFTEYEYDPMSSLTNKKDKNISALNKKEMTYVGIFKCTTYCPCTICNGGWTTTATGNSITPWHTIAVDPKVIPLGSTVYIEGLGTFKAHDTGGAIKGNKIDVCVNNHAYAQVQTWYDMQVYIIEE